MTDKQDENLSIPTDSAEDFLEKLTLWKEKSGWVSGKEFQTRWVFRGHRDERWELIPTSYRVLNYWNIEELPVEEKENLPRKLGMLLKIKECFRNRAEQFADKTDRTFSQIGPTEKFVKIIAHRMAEQEMLGQFLALGDDLSLDVPIDNHMCISGVDDLFDFHGRYKRPPTEPQLALAQHHGIPTNLIDWTGSPLAAAYFAATNVKKLSQDRNIVVYAINMTVFKSNEFSRLVTRIRPTRKSNFYLSSQDGLFLSYNYETVLEYYLNKGGLPTVDKLIQTFRLKDCFKKITLAQTEVPKLLRLLWSVGLCKARLMPTYDNVANTLLDLWDREDTPPDIRRFTDKY